MKPKIFIDLDGVIVDWSGGMLKLFNADANDPKLRPLLLNGDKIDDVFGGWDEVSRAVANRGPEFWTDLEFLPWGEKLIETVVTYFGATHDIAFLTSPGKFPSAGAGKMQWLLDNYPDMNLIICKYKHLCASPNAVLIDDAAYQIDPFIANGGFGILWPNQYKIIDNISKPADVLIDNLVKAISKARLDLK